VRVVEQLTIPAFTVDDPGPVCEDAQPHPYWWTPN